MNPYRSKLPITPEKLLEISEQFGTPTYVYDERTIKKQGRRLLQSFQKLPVNWLYAMKANDNPFLLDIIARLGFGMDTVSYEEALLGKYFVRNPADIFYTENNMTDAEMDAAIASGITLNIGSYSRLLSFFEHPKATSCFIRINPAIGDGHHAKVVTGNKESKFGIGLDLLEDAMNKARKSGKKIIGFHVHIGSGIQNAENFLAAMKILLAQAERFPELTCVNFGGGLPVPYKIGEAAFDMDEFENITRPILEDFLKKRAQNFSFFFEPGRWIVAQSGVLLSRVTSFKNQAGKLFLGTDTGFNHLLRPALYDAYHEIININRCDEPVKNQYDIAGNICESGDILGTDRHMPETKVGDILAIADAGAYGMTMASYYNRRALPAEILVCEDGSIKEIRKRANAEETIARYLSLTGFLKTDKARHEI